MQLVLYGTCLSALWKQHNRRKRLVFFHVAYITVLLLLESLVVVTVDLKKCASNYPGVPMAWFLA